MLHLLSIISFFTQAGFPSERPLLARTYYSTYNPGGAHAFQRKLVLRRNTYRETQYPTSATSLYKYTGQYRVKADTLIVALQKSVFPKAKYGANRSRKVEVCTEDTSLFCRPAYYLICHDSLIALRYSKAKAAYERSGYFLVAAK
jgi:hypothetical protein